VKTANKMIAVNLIPEDYKPPPRTFIGKAVRKGLKGIKTGIIYGGGAVLVCAAVVIGSPVWISLIVRDHYREETEKNLKRWIRKDPANSDLHLRLGRIYESQYGSEFGSSDDLEKAIAEFETAIGLDKDCASAYYGLAKCTSDPKLRFDYMKKAVKIDPNAKTDKGSSCSVVNHLWDVISDGIDSNVANKIVSELLGREYKRWEDLEAKLDGFESAVEDFERKLVDSPNSELLAEYARYLRENVCDTVEKFVGSKLQELIQRDPRNSALYYEYGKLLYSQAFKTGGKGLSFFSKLRQKEKKAIDNFLIAYEDPDFNVDDWDFYHQIAKGYLNAGDFGKAAIALERGLKTVHGLRDVSEAVLQSNFKKGLRVAPIPLPSSYTRSLLGSDIIEKLRQILHAQELVRGKQSDMSVLPEELRKKVESIKELRNAGLSDLGKMLLGGDDDDLDEYYDLKLENRIPLAKELNSLGLYDEAIKTLGYMRDRGAEAELLLADSYECKWRREGKEEFLEQAHAANFDASACYDHRDINLLGRIACTARYLGGKNVHAAGYSAWNDVVKRMVDASLEISSEAPPKTYETQLEEVRRHFGKNQYLKQRMDKADSEADPEKRVAILTEITEQAPMSFVIENGVNSKLVEAFGEYAPIVEGRMEETVASLASLELV
jgi:tetratricopeptide (TPR) repeat protein